MSSGLLLVVKTWRRGWDVMEDRQGASGGMARPGDEEMQLSNGYHSLTSGL